MQEPSESEEVGESEDLDVTVEHDDSETIEADEALEFLEIRQFSRAAKYYQLSTERLHGLSQVLAGLAGATYGPPADATGCRSSHILPAAVLGSLSQAIMAVCGQITVIAQSEFYMDEDDSNEKEQD